MGRDIDLIDRDGESVDHLYMSGNFWKYAADYWFPSDHHGEKTATVIPGLKKAIEKLESEGIEAIIPRGQDGWSATKEVFHYHLKHFLKSFEKHPNTVIVDDQCGNVDEDLIYNLLKDDQKSEDEDSKEDELGDVATDVIWIRHPIHGTMKVDTFEKAADIYTRAILAEDPRAPYWLELAQKLK